MPHLKNRYILCKINKMEMKTTMTKVIKENLSLLYLKSILREIETMKSVN